MLTPNFKSLTHQLLESQNHRCCICNVDIIFSNSGIAHPKRAVKVKLDFTQPYDYDNTVLTCCRCAGDAVNFGVFKTYEQYMTKGRRPKKRKFRTNTLKAYKRRLLELQNHRCCYCGHRLETEDFSSPWLASFEHINPTSQGGSWDLLNLAIACITCNWLRSRLDNMAADTFAVWASWNQDLIAEFASEHGMNNTPSANPLYAYC